MECKKEYRKRIVVNEISLFQFKFSIDVYDYDRNSEDFPCFRTLPLNNGRTPYTNGTYFGGTSVRAINVPNWEELKTRCRIT